MKQPLTLEGTEMKKSKVTKHIKPNKRLGAVAAKALEQTIGANTMRKLCNQWRAEHGRNKKEREPLTLAAIKRYNNGYSTGKGVPRRYNLWVRFAYYGI